MLSVVNEANHRDAVCRLVNHYGWCSGAELGVAGGRLSEQLLNQCPRLTRLYGVDMLRRPHRAERVRRIDALHQRYTLIARTTADAARRYDGDLLDFIFIDAGHSYEAVQQDIALWTPLVRPGGMVLGHDYGHPKYTGVARAVDEAFGERAEVLGHTIWAVER